MVFNKYVISLKTKEHYCFFSNIISVDTELGHSYFQWMITFGKWILTESSHSTLSSLYFSLFLQLFRGKNLLFFLAILDRARLHRASGWFRKLRSVPSKSNLHQALILNWINFRSAPCPILQMTPLLTQCLIIWAGSRITRCPDLPWWVEPLTLTSYCKLWL